MIRQLIIIAALLLLIPTLVFGKHLYKEKEYQEAWCAAIGGVMEYVLDDGTRVDCLTEEYAIEFDFAPKWAEAIGQSLYYAERTGKRPGIVLIMEGKKAARFKKRLEFLSVKYHIKVWVMSPAYFNQFLPALF